jgi:hypothetical protein
MKRLVYLFIIIAALVAAFPAAAQEADMPLIVVRFDDPTLYAYDGAALTPICAVAGEEPYGQVAVSPDGQRIAFMTRPAFVVAAPEGSMGEGMMANKLYFCDLASGATQVVADQPEGATTIDGYMIYSMPAWSPDGTGLAWNQRDAMGEGVTTILYDLAQGVSAEHQRPGRSAAFVIPGIEWGAAGVVYYDMPMTADGTAGAGEVTLIDPATGDAQTLPVLAETRVLGANWATFEGREVVVLNGQQGGEVIYLDPETGAIASALGMLEYYSRLAPETSVRLSPPHTEGISWVASETEGSMALGVTGMQVGEIAISPDGEQVAFITFENRPYGGKAYVMRGTDTATAARIADASGFFNEAGALYVYWAPLGMRIGQ